MNSENGIGKFWSPELEAELQERIETAPNFAARHYAMTTRDVLKFDHRSKAYKRALAQERLRMMTFTDRDCELLAIIKGHLPGKNGRGDFIFMVEFIKKLRDQAIKAGINKEDLEVY